MKVVQNDAFSAPDAEAQMKYQAQLVDALMNGQEGTATSYWVDDTNRIERSQIFFPWIERRS